MKEFEPTISSLFTPKPTLKLPPSRIIVGKSWFGLKKKLVFHIYSDHDFGFGSGPKNQNHVKNKLNQYVFTPFFTDETQLIYIVQFCGDVNNNPNIQDQHLSYLIFVFSFIKLVRLWVHLWRVHHIKNVWLKYVFIPDIYPTFAFDPW